MHADEPRWVDTVLDQRWTWFLARIGLTSAFNISGRFVWLGAGALGVLTMIATYVANDFWNMQGADGFAATNAFFEHIGLVAGFVLAAIIAAHEERKWKESSYAT
jgi:uncharacterized membrane protein YphA (DoxX/SURF4 family)